MDNTNKIADFREYKNKKLKQLILSKVDKEVYDSTELYHFDMLCNFMIDFIHNPELFKINDKKLLLDLLDYYKMESLVPLNI